MNIKVSIITVNYNNRTGLDKTIKSVLCQTYDNFEYIVIDGCSTDGSRELIEWHKDGLSYWCSEKDSGIYDAMNKGLKKTKGEYCLFLNSGDYLCNRTVLQEVFGKGEWTEDLIIGRQLYYDKDGKKSKAWRIKKEDVNERFFWSNTLPHQSTFIRTSLLKSVGGYNTQYKICADWVFWYRAVVEIGCSMVMIPTDISLMEEGGVSNEMEKCRAEMATFLMEHHSTMSKEDWMDISKRYNEALVSQRAIQSPLSKLLMKVAVRLNKK